MRVESLRRLSFVDVVVVQPTTDPTVNLERFSPDIFTHADGDGDWSALHARVEALGVRYVNLPYRAGVSSTKLRGQAA
jgi:glycerol-3-phosphate cytidylyltransferase-like family protein